MAYLNFQDRLLLCGLILTVSSEIVFLIRILLSVIFPGFGDIPVYFAWLLARPSLINICIGSIALCA
jgi:hypothetical protein